MTRRASLVAYFLCAALFFFGVWAIAHDQQTSDRAVHRAESRAAAAETRALGNDRRIAQLEAGQAERDVIIAAHAEQLRQLGVTPVATSQAPPTSPSTSPSNTPPSTNPGGQEPPGQQPERCTVKVLGVCI